MFVVRVKCPHPDCGKSLIDPKYVLNGAPATIMKARKGAKEGNIQLSSIYDDYTVVIPKELDIHEGDIVILSCPNCGKPFPEMGVCPDCGAPLAKINLESGGEIVICSRKGCKHHGIEFSNSNALLAFLEANSALK